MFSSRMIICGAMCSLLIVGCMGAHVISEKDSSRNKSAKSTSSQSKSSEIQQVSGTSRESYRVRFETSKGDVLIQVEPEWAPRGAKRFRELVESGFYEDCRFFRVIEDFVAQVGINGDPAINEPWSKKKFRDDPVIQSNKPGFVTFATSGPDSRTTQFFFNIGDNSSLDRQGFAPFGKVIEGQDVVASLFSKYGEQPQQDRIGRKGNVYLKSEFPRLDYIIRATIE